MATVAELTAIVTSPFSTVDQIVAANRLLDEKKTVGQAKFSLVDENVLGDAARRMFVQMRLDGNKSEIKWFTEKFEREGHAEWCVV